MNKHEWFVRTFSLFVILGMYSILLDVDHFFSIFGLEEPWNFSGWYGRPFHTILCFIVIMLIVVCIYVTPTNGSTLAIKLGLFPNRIKRENSSMEFSNDSCNYNIIMDNMVDDKKNGG